MLRPLAHWVAPRVLEAAEERRADGRLEFHDLLVLARRLLAAATPRVRAALHERYQRLLLDEFQDTDPIQIELAVRIAGGAAAAGGRWSDVDVPAGLAVRRRRPEAVDLPLPPGRHRHATCSPASGSARPVDADHQLPHRRAGHRLGQRACSAP